MRPAHPGVANHVFLLGEELVLRIPRTPAFVPDLRKEVEVIPAARAVGVRTPAVVAFDDSRSLLDLPYLVLVRTPGADLAQLDRAETEAGQVFQQVGRELAKLHRLTASRAAELPSVPADDAGEDPRDLVGRLRAEGHLDRDAARWLTGWFDRLATHLPPDPPHVLVHGDIAPQNLLVAPASATLTGIVDWGDAQWADPAVEFAKIPLRGVPAMLDGYRQGLGHGVPGAADRWEARILWHHLVWALTRLRDSAARPDHRHWSAPPASRLLNLLRFFASAPPAPWADLG